MGNVVQSGTSSSGGSWRRSQPFFVSHVLRQYGFRGVVAMLVAAAVAFVPLAILAWFNVFRMTSIISVQCGQSVVVKPGRFEQESDQDQPGDTALLQIRCEVPTSNGWRDLLRDDDPASRGREIGNSVYVRDERVYLRKAGNRKLPFGLLGRPPVSVWVPAGDYEIAVVHDSPPDRSLIDSPRTGYPLVTTFDSCTVKAREKTVLTIPLPHYHWGNGMPLSLVGQAPERFEAPQPKLDPLIKSLKKAIVIPTPGGYLLDFGEPTVMHTEDHRDCTVDFEDLHSVPREWNRHQIVTLKRWLPKEEEVATSMLSPLVADLSRREYLEGWFCYAMAGLAGLVFTKWGTLAILEPYRRRETLAGPMKLCVLIFLVSAAGWWIAAS
jgi:hypothetical protein